MTFGGTGWWKTIGDVGQATADELVGMALDGGVNFFDTADTYSDGLSEEILGRALGSRRKEIILATKVGSSVGADPNRRGLSRHNIIEGCHESLRRLQTDYVDLYQFHVFDPPARLEESLRAADDLVRQGKVRYIGCCNFTGAQLMKALSICERENWERFVTFQGYYSLLARDVELELVPLCQEEGLGVLTWSPLSGGFLTGKYRRGQPRPQNARRTDPEGQFLQFDEESGFDIVEELDRIARERGVTVAQTALNYLLRKQAVTSVITGTRTPDQLADNLKTVEWEMSDEELARLDAVSRVPRVYPHWMQEITSRRQPG
jgi:aryl-alcohol dehydrogenase-like predicted oxidoreductase